MTEQRETIEQLIVVSVRDHADRSALVAPGRADLTYGDLGRQIDATRQWLAHAGYGRGHRVAVALPNSPEVALAIVAIMCSATCAPINDELTQDDLERLLASMRIDALVAPDGVPSAAADAAQRLGIEVIGLRGRTEGPAGMFDLIGGGSRAAVPPRPPAPGDVALLMHTGGTTGLPKIVPLEHWRLAWGIRRRIELSGIDTNDRYLFVMPMRSMAALRRGLLLTLTAGATMICAPAFDSVTLVNQLDTLRPTVLMGPPVALLALVDEFERRSPRPPHTLKYVMSAFTSLNPEAERRLQSVLRIPIIVLYGATEAGQIAQSPLAPDTAPAGSVGWPYLHEIAVWDEGGNRLAANEIGEIVVRGIEVFAGYESNQAANEAALRDGWYRTGDTGFLDEAGFIFLTDRVNDLINRGGHKIVPSEIEDVLLRHPQVADAAAFGVPHPTLGQDVAVAVARRDPAPQETDLRIFVRSRLAPYKLPARYLMLDALPRTSLGKIDRPRLREIFAGRRELAFDPPRGPIEVEVARIFSDILGQSDISRSDSLFDRGGDSLRALAILLEAERRFGVSPGLDALFDHPTVAAFSALIGEQIADRDRGLSTEQAK